MTCAVVVRATGRAGAALGWTCGLDGGGSIGADGSAGTGSGVGGGALGIGGTGTVTVVSGGGGGSGLLFSDRGSRPWVGAGGALTLGTRLTVTSFVPRFGMYPKILGVRAAISRFWLCAVGGKSLLPGINHGVAHGSGGLVE